MSFIKQESRPGNTLIVTFEIAEGSIDDMASELAARGITIVTPVSHAPGRVVGGNQGSRGECPFYVPVSGQPRKR